MLQKTFFVKNTFELMKVFESIEKLPEYKNASDILALLYVNGFKVSDVKKYVDFINCNASRVKVAGISVMSSVKEFNKYGVSISFLIFESSKADIFIYESSKYNGQEIIDTFSKELEEKENAKIVLTYPANTQNNFPNILEELSSKYEDITFFGAYAGTVNPISVDNSVGLYHKIYHKQESITQNDDIGELLDNIYKNSIDHAEELSYALSDRIIVHGCVFVILSGEKLMQTGQYNLGWHPLGKEIQITGEINTDSNGNACIYELDGIPAADIYKKYLDVGVDEYFSDNVCEFPMITERNGTLIARVPLFAGDKKELYFTGDIYHGDKLRLSYAYHNELINNSKKAAAKLAVFKPQAVIISVCFNRFHFLKFDQYQEIEYYLENNNELLFGFGAYEIMKGKGCGGILNGAIAVLALSEGECSENSAIISVTDDQPIDKAIKPLDERLVTFIDVTARELNNAVKEAEKANDAKSKFLSSMSHEIRTPINAILGMNEMILRESKDEDILSYAENIRGAGTSLLGIVNDILDFSKIEAGKMEVIPVEYEVASVLNDLINMTKARMKNKDLELIVNIDSDLPHILYGDEIRIKQVVTNILTNAIKYTEKGSITLTIKRKKTDESTLSDNNEFDTRYLDENDRLKNYPTAVFSISIEDTGIGIKKEDLSRLFHAFERVDEKRNRTIEGTGLGMSITQNLLRLMGSELQVESEYGKGSKFYFDLVQKVVDPSPIGDFEEALKNSIAARKVYHESFIAPEAHLLIVDDTIMNIIVIINLLKKTQVQIEFATSGRECLQMTAEKRYDIIFLDHRMPEMDGIETLHRLHEQKDNPNADTPVIALTANAISGSREYYINEGFDDYISKPVDPGILENMIVKLLPDELIGSLPEENVEPSSEDLPEWIKKIPFIDSELGIKNCGSIDGLISAIKIYQESADNMQEEIRNHLKNNRLDAYTIKVHALKSSSRIIGAMDIGSLAEKLEYAGNDRDLDTINEFTDELLSYHKSLSYMIKRNLNEPETDEKDKETITEEKLTEAYNAIYEISQIYDYDTLKMIMDSLDGYFIPNEWKDRYDKLVNAYKNADWSMIQELAKGDLNG